MRGGATSRDAASSGPVDRRAFEALYRRHVDEVHSFLRRFLGSAGADDLTQDVFVRAWSKREAFRGDASFGTWVHRIAINLARDRRARERREEERRAPGAPDEEPAPGRDQDLALDFEDAVSRLPRGARHVFVLHDVEGWRHSEIASGLEISVGTSKSQLHRARMLLREFLRGTREDQDG